jgi:hypothetical protein
MTTPLRKTVDRALRGNNRAAALAWQSAAGRP